MEGKQTRIGAGEINKNGRNNQFWYIIYVLQFLIVLV
jgi:hypothetical protein